MIAEDYYSRLKEVFTNYDLLKYKSSLSAVQYIELYDKAIDPVLSSTCGQSESCVALLLHGPVLVLLISLNVYTANRIE